MEIDAIFKQRKIRWNRLKKARRPVENRGRLQTFLCKKCENESTESSLKKNMWICPQCGNYLTMSPKDRIKLLADEQTFAELDRKMMTRDPLAFPEYMQKIENMQEKTGNRDSVVTGVCEISGIKVAIGVLDANFMMGSMGTITGEKIARLSDYARKKKLPLLIYSASGGARMQEGLFSLLQMAKTSAAVQKFKDAGGLFISFLTNPTTGGVSASFASLGDIMIAEPDALIGFAGPRVIEQTIGQKLPEGFQRAEFLLEHGMLDLILERKEQKKVISQILKIHTV